MHVHSTKEDYLIKGHNGLETCVILSETPIFAKERKYMERETVKEVLRRFNEHGVHYCLIGGLSLAHHSIPRRTQDVDIMVLPEDLPLVQELLKGYQQRGTAVVLIFQIGETRIDIIPANLRAKRRAVLECIDDVLDELPVKVANLRDLILLKMWAAPDRPERIKRMQDETDIVGLIEMNAEKVSAEDIAYICDSLLKMVYSAEDVQKYRAQIEWLNSELEKLGLSDRRYVLP
jgi:predicted nucleotidyltransferase